MKQKIFETHPDKAMSKIAELRKKGWNIISTSNTSTPVTAPDAHGVSYGGPSFTILAERQSDLVEDNTGEFTHGILANKIPWGGR